MRVFSLSSFSYFLLFGDLSLRTCFHLFIDHKRQTNNHCYTTNVNQNFFIRVLSVTDIHARINPIDGILRSRILPE